MTCDARTDPCDRGMDLTRARIRVKREGSGRVTRANVSVSPWARLDHRCYPYDHITSNPELQGVIDMTTTDTTTTSTNNPYAYQLGDQLLEPRSVERGPRARINAIGTANPTYDFHQAAIDWTTNQLATQQERNIYERMMSRSGIDHRYSVLDGCLNDDGYFRAEAFPSTASRMKIYAEAAPLLGLQAVAALGDAFVPGEITHIVVASCTGFVAPGVDQIIADRLGLSSSVERLLVGFMGCYAAVTALKAARNIVRSDEAAKVLVLTIELCSLHLQDTHDLGSLVAMSLFSDGAAAAIVSAEGAGLAMERPFAATIPDSKGHICWNIGDNGFIMHLASDVATRLAEALAAPAFAKTITDGDAETIEAWAIHPGGRAILDAVEKTFSLDASKLQASRDVLRTYGNMSSATLMFVLAQTIPNRPKTGVAMAFGPGLAAEGFHIGWVD
jgi:alpha-pyrone synthase